MRIATIILCVLFTLISMGSLASAGETEVGQPDTTWGASSNGVVLGLRPVGVDSQGFSSFAVVLQNVTTNSMFVRVGSPTNRFSFWLVGASNEVIAKAVLYRKKPQSKARYNGLKPGVPIQIGSLAVTDAFGVVSNKEPISAVVSARIAVSSSVRNLDLQNVRFFWLPSVTNSVVPQNGGM